MRRFAVIHSSLFLGTVLVLGAIGLSRMPAMAMPAGFEIRVGEAARRFESHYDAVFPARTFGINFWAALQYLAFGEGRSGVVIGSDDWLYTLEEFRDWQESDQRISTHLQRIAQVQRQLAQRGTTLIVAPVPAKAGIYAEHRGGHQPKALHDALYQRSLAHLQAHGVVVADLRSALLDCKASQAVFLRTDTHWTPAGARCAANAIAARALQAGVTTNRPQDFVTEIEPARDHAGDLIGFLPLAPYFAALLPPADRLSPLRTVSNAEVDLLGNTAVVEVVLVGTSYSANPLWNFDGALREGLREDVLNLAESGHGPFTPMDAYLQNPDSPQARVLIWEIPVRYLPMDDSAPAIASTQPHPGETQ